MKGFLLKVFLILFVFGINVNVFGQYFESVQHIGGIGADAALNITTDFSGNIYTVGVFSDTVDFDSGLGVYNMYDIDSLDLFVSKMDSNNNILWVKSIESPGNVAGHLIKTDDVGNVYIAGQFLSVVDFDPGPGVFNLSTGSIATSTAGFVLKLNPNGDFVWVREYSGSGWFPGISGMEIGVNNDIYITGRFNQNIDFDPGVNSHILYSNGSFDIFVTKLNSTGNFVWAKSFGGFYEEDDGGIALDSMDNVYITGSFTSSSIDFDPGPGTFTQYNSDFGSDETFISKLDNNGNFIWAKTIKGDGNVGADHGEGIKADKNGYIYIYGSFGNTSDFDPGPGVYNLTSVNSYGDFFFLKLNSFGDFVWVNTWSDASCSSIQIDDIGEVYLAGNFLGTIDFDWGSGTANLDATQGILFVTKINNSGDAIWAVNFGHQFSTLTNYNYSDAITAIQLYNNNSLLVSGRLKDSSDFNPGIGINTLSSYGGLDAFTLKLADCENTFSTTSVLNCSSYISPSGNITFTTPGYYTFNDTIINSCGYDSILTINLTLNSPSLGSIDSVEACDNYTWTNGITYYNNNTSATDTFVNICGLDSVVQLHLTISNSSFSVDNQIACSTTYTWIDGNTYSSNNNTATDTVTNSFGCDSIIQLNLTFQSGTVYDTTIVNSCNSYTWINGTNYTSSQNDLHLWSVNGCVVFYYLYLTINPSFNITNSIEACDSAIYNGFWYYNSQVLTDTVGSGLACDSIIFTDIIIHSSFHDTLDVFDCDSSQYNGTWYYSSQQIVDTMTSVFGCDSSVTLNLTILNSSLNTDIQTACNSYTWIDGNTYTSSNNTATYTLINSMGCDSIITLNLTILNSTSNIDIQTACSSYVWIDGNTYTSSNNTATYTLTNTAGCDSIITLNLTILDSDFSDIQTACNNYTWLDGNTYTSSNNTATHTITNASGCDSIITLDLTIENSTTSTDIEFAPIPFTWIDGNTYTTDNNTTTEILTNAAGCDSIVTLNLTIIDTIIQGNITTSLGVALQNSKVYLIQHFASQDSVFATDSTFTDALGFYQFPNTFQNAYVKAIPDAISYPNEVPTYNLSSAVFQNADAVYLSYPFGNTDFSTIAGVNPGGNGFIGGIVGNGAGKNSEVGELLPNISLVLINSNDEVVGQTLTDINGHFEFDNLEESLFSIWVDKAGVLNNLAPEISLAADNNQDDLKFVLHKTYLDNITSVGIENMVKTDFKIFPNPTNKIITIQNTAVLEDYSVELYNILGEKVYTKKSMRQSLNIDLKKMELSHGTYFVKVATEKGAFVSKVVYR